MSGVSRPTVSHRSIVMTSTGPNDLEGLILFFLELPNGIKGTSFRRTRTGFDVIRGNEPSWEYFSGPASNFMVATRICEKLALMTSRAKLEMMVGDGSIATDEGGRELTGWRATSQPVHGRPGVYGLHITPAWV